ncbi:MAG TPA: hypothetical protein VFE72_01280 [Lysobacter sp.]|nr:hypothetical protein [Lysobacter sp.]
MMFEPMHPLEDSTLHTRWLHELRNAVSTASVAAAMARRLVGSDVDTAADMLQEAERALLACRELLAGSGEHVLSDGLPHEAPPSSPMPAVRRHDDGDSTAR